MSADFRTYSWEQRYIVQRLPLALRGLITGLINSRPSDHPADYYGALAKSLTRALLFHKIVNPSTFLRNEVWVRYKKIHYIVTNETIWSYFQNTFEPKTSHALCDTKGTIAIDVGANCGQYSLPLSKKFTKVIAIEPNPIALDVLKRNVAKNIASNVEIRPIAILPQEGLALLRRGAFLSTWGVEAKGEVAVTVDGKSLDQILEKFRAIDLLKLDVEGIEHSILLGSRLLNRVSVLCFSLPPPEVRSNVTPLLIRHLISLGFDRIGIPEAEGDSGENAFAMSTCRQSDGVILSYNYFKGYSWY
ncbi:MAG: FkbM family methyltransferase [Nitrososphaerota archaeon]|jgi:FkbM family methyltransferase|nr:FkbM family methyltransferase [Nitrososphaerota archaeon]